MPRDGDISNSKQYTTGASKESKAWLVKRVPDRALLFTALSPIHTRTLSLASYIRQQSRHLGEGSTRLAHRLIDRRSLASTASRSFSLPLLSRTFDYILRKSAVAQPVWQRALDLTWYHRHRKPRPGFTETTGTTADGRPTQVSLLPDERHHDAHLRTLSESEKEQPGDAIEETYPALIKGLIPPVAREIPPATTHELSHPARVSDLPPRTRLTADSAFSGETTQPPRISRKEKPAQPVAESYPALIKGLIPPVAGEIPYATTYELPHPYRAADRPSGTKQTADRGDVGEATQPLHISRKEGPAQPVAETYPALIKGLIPPVAGEIPPATTHELPHPARVADMPPRTRQTPDRAHTVETTQPMRISRKEGSVQPVDATYPALIKGLITPVVGERSPATTHEFPHIARAPSAPLGDKQGTGSLETEGAQRMPARVDRQTGYIHQRQSLSQVLKRTQQMILQGKYLETRPHVTPESIHETTTFPILPMIQTKAIESEVESTGVVDKQTALPPFATAPEIEVSDQPTIQPVHILRVPASHKQPATLPGKNLPGISPDQIKPVIVKDTFKEPGPSIIQRTAKYISRLVSKPFLPEKLTYSKVTAAPPLGVSYKWAPQIGQAWRQRPPVGPSIESAGQQTDVTYQTKAITDLSQSPDILSSSALEHDRTGRGFAEGRGDKSPFYGEPSSVAGPLAKPLLVPASIQRMMTLPSLQLFKSSARTPIPDRSETYGFAWDQEYVPTVPGYDYIRQPAPELPLASSIQRKAEPGTARSEELLTDIPYTTPEFTYSRRPNVPELALARASRGSETTVFRTMAPETRTEGPAEEESKPDIDAIASDVYRILRRRLISERERTFGVT